MVLGYRAGNSTLEKTMMKRKIPSTRYLVWPAAPGFVVVTLPGVVGSLLVVVESHPADPIAVAVAPLFLARSVSGAAKIEAAVVGVVDAVVRGAVAAADMIGVVAEA